MSLFTSSRSWRVAPAAIFTAALLVGCGLTATNQRPTFEELEPEEQGAVDIIIQELSAFNGQIKARTVDNIDSLVDREKIHVSFEGYIFTANLGDGVIHVATWENLSEAQRALVQKWFGLPTADAARDAYRKFFYRFMAVSQGAKQYMFEVLTTPWVYSNRSLFNLERDSIRTAMSHFQAIGRRAEIWNFVESVCAPMIAQYDATYASKFNKVYLKDNFAELAKPEEPTGYMYFICRWYRMGVLDSENLTIELDWLRTLPDRR